MDPNNFPPEPTAEELDQQLAGTDDCQPYLEAYNGLPFQRAGSGGFSTMTVLPQLTGQPFDHLALAWIHALRPSSLRVSRDGCVCTDARCNRVTVFLDTQGKIERIEQEVEVGYGCGADINGATRRRLGKTL